MRVTCVVESEGVRDGETATAVFSQDFTTIDDALYFQGRCLQMMGFNYVNTLQARDNVGKVISSTYV